ncbi:MAG: hypothetical protein BWZ01_02177 [Deltaproteobacteria bacterium ADurb.BinA179]|nr:MAG: hypothetical protein BWZ01_02177 [Deltaproteobacteria bacterium ADurb.BinA179]
MLTISVMMPMAMLNVRRMSRRNVGSGTSTMTKTTMTPKAMTISLATFRSRLNGSSIFCAIYLMPALSL